MGSFIGTDDCLLTVLNASNVSIYATGATLYARATHSLSATLAWCDSLEATFACLLLCLPAACTTRRTIPHARDNLRPWQSSCIAVCGSLPDVSISRPGAHQCAGTCAGAVNMSRMVLI